MQKSKNKDFEQTQASIIDKGLNWKIIQIFVCKKLTVVSSDALHSLYN